MTYLMNPLHILYVFLGKICQAENIEQGIQSEKLRYLKNMAIVLATPKDTNRLYNLNVLSNATQFCY